MKSFNWIEPPDKYYGSITGLDVEMWQRQTTTGVDTCSFAVTIAGLGEIFNNGIKFVQTDELTEAGIGVTEYGVYLCPVSAILSNSYSLEITVDGYRFIARDALSADILRGGVGTSLTFLPKVS